MSMKRTRPAARTRLVPWPATEAHRPLRQRLRMARLRHRPSADYQCSCNCKVALAILVYYCESSESRGLAVGCHPFVVHLDVEADARDRVDDQ
jgi:hypothetical protein